jgi:exopolysaccharide production protein ExoZ
MRVNSIQVLRGFAAMLVVYHHSINYEEYSNNNSMQQTFFYLSNFGCIGVDLFFVISGFIITFSTKEYKGFQDGFIFLEKRFIRINPIYYLATIALLAIFLVKYFSGFSKFSLDGIPLQLVNTIFIFPIMTDASSFDPLLFVGWTLSFEWLFYILFVLTIILKLKAKIFLPLLMFFLVTLGIILKPDDFRLSFLVNPIMLEFILGILIFIIFDSFQIIPVRVGFIFLLLGASLYLFMIFKGYGNVYYHRNTIEGNLSLIRFIVWGVPSAFIVAGSVFLEKSSKVNYIWNNKYLLLIGNASYSIYLIHPSILEITAIQFKKYGHFVNGDLVILIYVTVCVVGGVVFFKRIETPLLTLYKKLFLKEIPGPIRSASYT